MNDHDAMTAINAALEDMFDRKASQFETLSKICKISGRNLIEHTLAAK